MQCSFLDSCFKQKFLDFVRILYIVQKEKKLNFMTMGKFVLINVGSKALNAEIVYRDNSFVVFKYGVQFFVRANATGRFLIADKKHEAFDGYRILPDRSLIVNLNEDSLIARPDEGYFIKNPYGVEMKLRNVKHSQNQGQRGCAIVGTFFNNRKQPRKVLIQAGENQVWKERTKKWSFVNIRLKNDQAVIRPLYHKAYVFRIALAPSQAIRRK